MENAVNMLYTDLHRRTYEITKKSHRAVERIELHKAALVVEWFMQDFAPEKKFVKEEDLKAQEFVALLQGSNILSSLLVPSIQGAGDSDSEACDSGDSDTDEQEEAKVEAEAAIS